MEASVKFMFEPDAHSSVDGFEICIVGNLVFIEGILDVDLDAFRTRRRTETVGEFHVRLEHYCIRQWRLRG